MTLRSPQGRLVVKWLMLGTGFGLVLLNAQLASLVVLVLLVLAVAASRPTLGPALLQRIGWARLPVVGALSGLAASGALVAGAVGVGVAHVSLVPPAVRATPAASASPAPSTAASARSTAAQAATATTAIAAPTAARASASASPAATATPFPSGRQQARVLAVIDGDTIRVELDGRTVTIRYIGVDTPETVAPGQAVQAYGPEATEANRRLVEGRTVLLEKDLSETDSFGRLLRYVYTESFTGTTMVNAELVRLGYARVATYPPDVRYQSLFLELERDARASARGLWAAGSSASTAPSAAAATVRPTPTLTSAPASTATAAVVRTATPTSQPTPAPTAAPTSAPATAASGTLTITTLFYDGLVSRTEADEYVEIRNNGASAVSLSGWRLVSARAGQTYAFPAVTIQAGQTCRVYTNQVHTQWCGLSWGRGSAVWNNDGDRANLVAPDGTIVSSVGYKGW